VFQRNKGISSGPTQIGDANGPSWSVCVEAQKIFVSQSDLPGRRAQRRDTSCPTLASLSLAMANILAMLAMRP
jgi:hypothetical protein